MPPLPKIPLPQEAELFHTADGLAYADVQVNGRRETWPIRSKSFRQLLRRCAYEKTGRAPSAGVLQSALHHFEAKAQFDGPERAVYVRVGALGGMLYHDLCDHSWRAVEIDAAGWRVIVNPPVRFRRTPGMRASPVL